MALTEGQSVDPAVLKRYVGLVSHRAGSRRDYVVQTPFGEQVIEVDVVYEGKFLRRRKPRYVSTLLRSRESSLVPLRDHNNDEVFPFTQIIWEANGNVTKKTGVASRPANDRYRPTERDVKLGSMLQARVDELMGENTTTEEMLDHIQLLEQAGSGDRIIYRNYNTRGKTRKERWWETLAYFMPQPPRYEAKNPF